MVNPILDQNKLKKGLYLVPTPIGNLGDITFRAVEVLRNSDYILCEDTRVSKNLLVKFKINSKLISNHKFNEVKNLPKIIDLLTNDKIISMISDAGTPSISDPGIILINECLKKKNRCSSTSRTFRSNNCYLCQWFFRKIYILWFFS